MKIEIGDIERIRLEPGDKIAVKVPAPVSMAAAQELREKVSAALGIDAARVLVLVNGISLAVEAP